ncbi:MAG: KH domain-containing protein [Eubacteriales bacterium]|nr:KH domain-containing protein [Eubacteriales bacterium]
MSREADIQEIKDLLAHIAKSLVDRPDEVQVNAIEKEDNLLLLELRVADDDMGRVIGKSGRRAQAIRSIIKAKAARSEFRSLVDIVDDNEEEN